MNFNSKKSIIITATTILALVFVLQVIGKPLVMPFPASTSFTAPGASLIAENKESVVIDKNKSRIMFLNEKHQIRRITNLNSSSLISQAIEITSDDKYFYISGYKFARNTNYIQFDRVIRYDLDGSNPVLLYERPRNDHSSFQDIIDIDYYEDNIYLTINDPVGKSKRDTTVVQIDTDPKTDDKEQIIIERLDSNIYFADYNPAHSKLYYVNHYGKLHYVNGKSADKVRYANGNVANILHVTNDDDLIWFDSSLWKLFINEKCIDQGKSVTNINNDNGSICYSNTSDNNFYTYNCETGEIKAIESLPYSPAFALVNVLRFISIIYISVLVLILIGGGLIHLYKAGDKNRFQQIAIVVIAELATLLIIVFFVNQIYQSREENITHELHTTCSYFAETLDEESLENSYDNIERYLKYQNLDNNNEYINLYKLDEGNFRLIYDSLDKQIIGLSYKKQTIIDYVEALDGTPAISTFTGRSVLVDEEFIYDSNENIIGAVEVGRDYSLFVNNVNTELFELVMKLLIIFVAIYMLSMETINLFTGLSKRKKKLALGSKGPEVAVTRTINFFFTLLVSFDEVILVIVAMDMLHASGVNSSNINTLIAIPTLLTGIGYTVGTILYNILVKKTTVKKLCVSSLLIMCISVFGIIFAVITNTFWIFCAMKFISSLFNNIVYSTFTAMPYRGDNEEEIFKANRDRTLGVVSAGIIGNLIGGLVAQTLGNVSVYVISALTFIPIILLLIFIMPSNCYYVDRSAKTSVSKNSLKTFLKSIISVPMMSYIVLILVPLFITGGYKNYLFPLYSTEADLPKMYITSFYVCATALMMIVNGPITKFITKFDHWWITVIGVLGMGLAFTCFAINSTLVWAIIMLFINAMFDRIIKTSKTMIWPRHIEKVGLDTVECSGYMGVLEQLIYSFKETILSFFLIFGSSGACTIVGIFCIICAIAFGSLTRKSAMKQ